MKISELIEDIHGILSREGDLDIRVARHTDTAVFSTDLSAGNLSVVTNARFEGDGNHLLIGWPVFGRNWAPEKSLGQDAQP